MKILLAGRADWVAKELAECLYRRGHQVISLDILDSNRSPYPESKAEIANALTLSQGKTAAAGIEVVVYSSGSRVDNLKNS